MIQGIVSGADSVEGHGDMWAKKQAGMLSMRTASQKPGTFNTLLGASIHNDEEKFMTRRTNLNETNRSIRKDSTASGGAVTGANSTMMMDTGVDLLSRVQMF
jgi:hypothetical protein